MPCYFPMQARFVLSSDGKKILKFSNKLAELFKLGSGSVDPDVISLPCGNCIGCRLERSRQWAVRMMHESKCYEDNCFVTLTYSDENLPEGGSLCRKDVQDFLKRLRFAFSDRKIRVFYCGEYGENLNRPHYHFCLFNCDFKDREFLFKIGENVHYRSSKLESLWTDGISSITDFSYETAAYVARYCLKKVNGSLADSYYSGRVPEFAGMSLKPGIGRPWLDKFGKSDVFPHDNVVIRGVECKTPRYYDSVYEKSDPEGFARVKEARRKRAESKSADSTFDRLADRLKCQQARCKKLPRKLEKLC